MDLETTLSIVTKQYETRKHQCYVPLFFFLSECLFLCLVPDVRLSLRKSPSKQPEGIVVNFLLSTMRACLWDHTDAHRSLYLLCHFKFVVQSKRNTMHLWPVADKEHFSECFVHNQSCGLKNVHIFQILWVATQVKKLGSFCASCLNIING